MKADRELGTYEHPFVRDREGDRRYRWCKCHACDEVSVCTPVNDFYTRTGAKEDWLYCESCLLYAKGK